MSPGGIGTNCISFSLSRSRLQEAKLMYGMLFSIKSFVSKVSPVEPREGFLYYKTNKYALHYLEVPSGLKFVLNTDNTSTGIREFLQNVYTKAGVSLSWKSLY